MTLPPESCSCCWRGLKNKDNFDNDGIKYIEFFQDFHDLDRDEMINWEGTSVNWDLDEEGALNEIMDRPSNRQGIPFAFNFGAIKLSRELLDGYVTRHSGHLSYELFSENGNDYHGHLLISKNIDKPKKLTICVHIADCMIDKKIRNSAL